MNNKQKKEFHPEYFKNTLKINIGENNISRKDVVEGLKLVVDLKLIDNICQYKSRKFWYIAFVDQFNSNNLLDKEITIKDIKFTFEQTIKQSIFKCFKISWLPPKFNKIDQIARILCAGEGEFKKINQLKDSDGLNLNIYNISIEYPINNSVKFLSITGKKQAFGETIFITRYGDQMRCAFCEEFGHKKSDCGKYKQICNQCGKRGHTVCTMAHKIATEEEDIEIDIHDDEAINEEKLTLEKEKGNSQANTLTLTTKPPNTSETTNSKQPKATSNANNKQEKKKTENKNINNKENKKPQVIPTKNDSINKGKRKGTDSCGSAEKQVDKKLNNQEFDNKSNNSSLNNVDLDTELTEEDVNNIAIALSKQFD